MKLLSACLALFISSTLSQTIYAQESSIPIVAGAAYQLPGGDAAHPCISDAQYTEIEQRCAASLALLGREHIGSQRSAPVHLGWPLRMANGLSDGSYYMISAYVDQDPASGSVKDWNCGTTTYDTHRGTDICTFPYPFYKMDNNQVEVISAADGVIIDRHDGEFDRNCVHSSAQANYVVIQHSDGTFAYYFHMKKNSVTQKAVGQSVAAGEYLGVVGSSGDANGPHLHFEVRTANSAASYKDPYAGGCNSLNAGSWWTVQKPYTEPAVIKAQVGATDPVLAACPTTETPHDDACLAPGSTAHFYTFLRNEAPGLTASMRLIGPAGTEVGSWSQASTVSHLASIYGWTRKLPATPGTYTFQAVYGGVTTSKTFQISSACAAITGINDPDASQQLQVYPNPTSGKLTIDAANVDNGNYTINIKNMLGQTMLTDQITTGNNSIQKTISIAALPDGIYFLVMENGVVQMVRKVEKR